MNHLGYYLQFKDGVDEKFQEIKDSLSNTPGLYGIDDVDLFKKMVKAELVTKYPNLGGAISEEDEDTKFQGAIKVRRITPNKAIGEVRNTGAGESTAGDIIYTENTEGDAAEEQYVLALSAEHNTDDLGPTSVEGDLKAGEMNVIVAEYVRQMLSKYPQIQVVQTGSTSENRNVPEAGRWQAAVDNQADMVIGIDFNMTQDAEELEGENGVSVLYNTQGFTDSGTYITGGSNRNSHTLGEILKVTVATKLTLEVTDDEVGQSDTIGYGNNPDIPSVIVKGGYLTGDKDYDVLKEEEALVDYAEGIVDAILQYWDIPYNGYGAISTEESTVTTDVESHVRDLTYITPERFDELVNTGNAEVLEYFTLDEDFNIVTASWSYDNGTTTFNKSTKNYRSLLENYTMPFEYLLFLLINSGRDDFVDGLAEEVMNAEIILAIEDNVTTTQVDYNEYTMDYEMYNSSNSSTDVRNERALSDWNNINSTTTITETCTSNVEITYAKTWCVIYSKDLTFNDSELGIDDGSRVDFITTINGTINDTVNTREETIAGEYTHYRTEISGYYVDEDNQRHPVYRYRFRRTDLLKKTDTHVITNNYNTGSTPEIEERSDTPFVALYNRLDMTGSIHNSRLFRIMEKNEKTADMVDLTKYLLYLATGTSIDDIREFPEDEFNMGSFSGATGIYGNTIQEKVWFALKGLGLSDIAAAGAMGNIHYESGGAFDPAAVERGYEFDNAGIGLCQWTNYPRSSGNGRHTNLINFANSRGKEWSDGDIQVEFLVAELTPGGGADGFASYELMTSSTRYDGIRHSPDEWKNASDIETATKIFCYTFERPGASDAANSMPERVAAANTYYNEFQGRTAPSGDDRIGDITLSGENATKMRALLEDAVRIADDDQYVYVYGAAHGGPSEWASGTPTAMDCSSFVGYLYWRHFGMVIPGSTSEYGSEGYVGSPGSVQLQPGDILWRSGHVEMYIGNNMRVGAHSARLPIPDQVSVESYTPPGNFTKVYRFVQ